ncbi:tRNA uridine(34) 5-carboxymethylaminomethyl modification radical SAM/GNAT enzyme Elp3 [Halococcoides cellulosivorans]|uniref:tRNA uridine(34) 5-carboxymethylaminomethyl modification radical SAM/GNAT enzyme Elp3 n=1 Tax=Halococcoides cellulosivorans TaxID=1679096 RepID=UPI001F219E0D|nr:tRNA uridine(34) 5-carboxymethylaminomethyl modification radical SAM/GNAT enzyme Elp3 [Halococcoides cellulosivorans]
MSSESFAAVCRDLVERILDGELERSELEGAKLDACSEHGAAQVPKNADLLDHAPDGRRDELAEVVRRKPVRTASGVAPVAIMTSPENCPHGQCVYCPGGPDSEFSSAQSYTGEEPAAARAEQNEYDPYGQVTLRLNQLRHIGHPVEKVELIVMGGTMTARSHDYQSWFVKRALQAMNEFDPDADPRPAEDRSFAQSFDEYDFEPIEATIAKNETGRVRNVTTTFETKPDWCGPTQIDRMLELGVTKVEVGVQTTHPEVLDRVGRGHDLDDSIAANRRLRDAGFKVGFHMMPGLPGHDERAIATDFRRIFESERWRPDYLKIYPTLVVEGTVLYDQWQRDEFDPLTSERAAELVADAKARIPEYTRLSRVQRDIPAGLIDAGVQKSNLRQLARQRLDASGRSCDCIRCREVGMADEEPDAVELRTTTYDVAGGTEHFLQAAGVDRDALIGFARLREPGTVARPELDDAAVLRELHVYGSQVGIETESSGWQHRGWGGRLLDRAERIAGEVGYDRLAVLAGIGAREYYRDRGYRQDGPYCVIDT